MSQILTILEINDYNTLISNLQLIESQTKLPYKVLIYDFSVSPIDLREIEVFQAVFAKLSYKNILWELVFGKMDQTQLPMIAITNKCDYIWQVTDTNNITATTLVHLHESSTHRGSTLSPVTDSTMLSLVKKYNPEWYKFKLSNHYERAVFLKGDPVFPRETTRYQWAASNLLGNKVLEIGCSSGYGIQFLPDNIEYTGVDYDSTIIDVARNEQWRPDTNYVNCDINQFALEQYDTIIAFEVIEHLDNGLELVNRLKNHCKRLLITVPYKEPVGFWGEHHKLHMLDESYFPGFEFKYINEAGNFLDAPDDGIINLMVCKYDNE